MHKLTLIIQTVALILFVAIAMLAHNRHRTAPAVIRFGAPSPAVDVQGSTPETGSKRRLARPALRRPMLAFALPIVQQSSL